MEEEPKPRKFEYPNVIPLPRHVIDVALFEMFDKDAEVIPFPKKEDPPETAA